MERRSNISDCYKTGRKGITLMIITFGEKERITLVIVTKHKREVITLVIVTIHGDR